jgi:dienelactone hydrolase
MHRLLLCLSLLATEAAAQQTRFFYPEPPAAAVRITNDIKFGTADTVTLAMDVYRPANVSSLSPALIFYVPFWTEERRSRTSNDWATGWARIAAANGIVAIIPDIRAMPGTGNATAPTRPLGDDFPRFLAYLGEHASALGVDREQLAVFAASGSVSAAFPAVEDSRQTSIKAAVMYYGSADVATFRLDLPVLYVRAGLDSPDMNAAILQLASRAAAQNAPITLVNHHSGYHAFEARNDDAVTRRIIDQTIDFVKQATTPAFQAAIRDGRLEALASGHITARQFGDAALTYAELLKRRPTDSRVRFSYARALLGDKQYGAACTEIRRLTPVSFEAILPGTRSCVLAGQMDTTVAWLQSIRKDWLRSEYVIGLRRDSVYAPLWHRADFQALFQP